MVAKTQTLIIGGGAIGICCAHVMDEQDRIVGAHLPAAVYDLLCAPLHLGIAALHRGKVQILAAAAADH